MKLAVQNVAALLITPERGVGTALLELQAHERAMDDFLSRIECQQPAGCLGRVLPPASFDLHRQQLSENGKSAAPVVKTLAREPLIESRDSAGKAFQKIAAVEVRRFPQRVDRPGRDERVEARHIDV